MYKNLDLIENVIKPTRWHSIWRRHALNSEHLRTVCTTWHLVITNITSHKCSFHLVTKMIRRDDGDAWFNKTQCGVGWKRTFHGDPLCCSSLTCVMFVFCHPLMVPHLRSTLVDGRSLHNDQSAWVLAHCSPLVFYWYRCIFGLMYHLPSVCKFQSLHKAQSLHF